MPYLVRNLLTEFYVAADLDTTFQTVLSKLAQMGLDVAHTDQNSGHIVVKYLTLLVDMLLYRCYSDRVLIEVRQLKPGECLVKVFALPAWNRVGLKRGETLREPAPLWYALERLGTPKS